MSSRKFLVIYPSSESYYLDISSIESKVYSHSSELHCFPTKFPSSNCAKVIIFPVCSWDDVAYGIYKTAGCIASASENRLNVFAKPLKIVLSNTTSYEETIFSVLGIYIS